MKYKVEKVESYHPLYLSSFLNLLKMHEEEKAGHKFRWGIPAASAAGMTLEAFTNYYHYIIFRDEKRLKKSHLKVKITEVSSCLEVNLIDIGVTDQQLKSLIDARNFFAHPKPILQSKVVEWDKGEPLPRYLQVFTKEDFYQKYKIEVLNEMYETLNKIMQHWNFQGIRLGLTYGDVHMTTVKPLETR